MAINVTDTSFKQEVLDSSLPVLVDFWAPWCGPCKMLTPIIEEFSKDMQGKIKVVKVNVDQNPAIASQYDIRTIPTMIVFKNGGAMDTKIGMLPKNKLQEWVETTIR